MKRRIFEFLLLSLVGFAVYKGWYADAAKKDSPTTPTTPTISIAQNADTQKIDEQIKKETLGNQAKVTLLNSLKLPEIDRKKMLEIHTKFATGDFVGAATLAEFVSTQSIYSVTFQNWLLQQMPTLFTAAGWTKLRLGDCELGTTYLLKAEAMLPALESSKGLAICYYKLRNFAAAREWFDRYFKINPNDEQLKVLYTDVLESDGKFNEAVDILEEILKSRAETENLSEEDVLQQRLDSMKERASEDKKQLRDHSLNFTISYRPEDHEGLIVFVLNTLEEGLTEYINSYGFLPPKSPIEVILYPKETFGKMIVGGPDWAIGLYDGRLRIPVDSTASSNMNASTYMSLESVLRHELVHAMIALKNDHRNLPSWLDEGLAQRFACQKTGCRAYQFGATPGDFLEPADFNTAFTSYSAQKARMAYRQSLYLIYTLEKLYGYEALERIVNTISKSSPLSSDSFLKTWNTNFAELHDKASRYWNSREPLKGAH